MRRNLHLCSLLLLALFWLGSKEQVQGQVHLSSLGATYSQDFNSLAASGTSSALPAGWAFQESGTNANTVYTAGTGSSTSGDTYSFGATSTDTDRALGGVLSGSLTPTIGAGFKNTSGETIKKLRITYTGEIWRLGATGRTDRLDFQYSLDATSLVTGTYVDVNELDFSTPATVVGPATTGLKVGNAAENRSTITFTIENLNIAPEEVFWIRWSDFNASGSDDGLAVDDFSLIPSGAAPADVAAPVLATTNPFAPADDAANVATNAVLALTFNENIKAGSGNVILYNLTDNTSQTLAASTLGYSHATATLTGATLLAGKSYAVQVPAGVVTDLVGNAFAGFTDNTTWNFSTAAAPTPAMTTSQTALAFAFTAVNKASVAQSYTLSASDLEGPVTVSVNGPFKVSKDNSTFASSLTYTAAELANAQTVYVRFEPIVTGSGAGSITHAATNATGKVISLSGSGIDPYNQNFNDPAFLSNSGWVPYSVSGAEVWASTHFGRSCLTGCNAATPDKAAQMNGFAGGAQNNEDWLISPEMDLGAFTNLPILSFWSISAFAGEQLKLKYATDYTGSGNPNAATWTEIPNVFPAANSNLWTLSQGIELPKASRLFVAFVYTSHTSAASRWTVDDFKVEDLNSYYTIPGLSLNFGEVNAGSTSDAQSFTFRAKGYGDLTLTAPAGYQLSADNGTTFAASAAVAQAEAAAGKQVLVRFAPTAKQLTVTGQIAFSGTNLSVSGISLTGSSYPKSETFDVATYNLEFFASNLADGSGEFGPTDDALQVANVTQVMKRMGADIYGIQELSEEAALDEVIAQMPGYAKVISPRYSYSFQPTDPAFPLQKIGFVYNSNTLALKGQRVMFEQFYDQVRAGTATVPGYPTSGSSLWSSGRLPFMATFDVTINGITKRVRVINIHAKSGSAAADYERRKFDVQLLHDSLMTHYPNDNIILIGDYNDEVNASIRTGFTSTYKPFVDNNAGFRVLTYELSQSGAASFLSSSSFLDHLIISDELSDEYIANSTAVEDARAYISNYVNTTSDHLPVTARFAFSTKDSQTISFATIPDKIFGDAPVALSASATSRLAVSFAVVEGSATVSGSTLTLTGAGTVKVRASQSGDIAFEAAPDVEQTFSVAKAAQTIMFATIPAKTFGDAPFDLGATASSGLNVTFTVVSGPATVSGNTLTLTGAGEVTIRASQAGNTNYLAAADVTQTFPVGKANQTITFAALANKVFGDSPFALSATASSGLAVTYSVVSGPATISGNTLTLTGAGEVGVRASQSGNENFRPAEDVTQTFTVGKAAQTISFAAIPAKTFGDAAFNLSAASSAGLPVTFTVVSGPATLSGNTLTLRGAGTVVVKATQAGNANYQAAADVEQTFAVAKAAQTITFTALSNKTEGDAAFTLGASASSGLAVTYMVVSGPATISGSTVTLTGAGPVHIKAAQSGNADYQAATEVEQGFCVNPAKPVITATGVNLSSSSAAGNQWYRNEVQIAGATNQTFHATQGGSYTVQVSAGTCVSAVSEPVQVVIAGVEAPQLMKGFRIYPNPATVQLEVNLANAGVGEVVVTLYDLTGRRALRRVYASGTSNFEVLLPMAGLPRNHYLLVIAAPKGVVRKSVVLK